MRQDTRIQIIAALALFLSLVGGGALAPAITAEAGRAQLGYADRAESSDPPEVALGVALGAFRGLFVNLLWFRAETLKREGKFHEAIQLSRAITKLQPRFPRVWTFLAWNMAYNISVATNTAEERWQWVKAGIDLLRSQGIPRNPNDTTIHKELAWIFFHKIQGVMDDAHHYYKRQLAREWTFVLGPPPPPAPTFEERVQQRIDILQRIAQAPDTLEQLYEQTPKARELIRRLREEADLEPGFELLRLFELRRALDVSWAREHAGLELIDDNRNRAMEELITEEYADAWTALLNYTRKRLLIDRYRMEPDRMIRYTRQFGPLDWRHGSSHAIYWANRGVEEGERRKNFDDFDFLNTDRVITAAIQDLYRWGDIQYSLLNDSYVATVNFDFARVYGDVLNNILQPRADQRAPLDTRQGRESSNRPYRQYGVGYENFLQDVVRTFYRMGDRETAERYYEELRTWNYMNVQDPEGQMERFGKPLDEFIQEDLAERASSPQVAQMEITSSLRDAYIRGLLGGRRDIYEAQREYARDFHRYYLREQNVRTLADERNRMALIPERFIDMEVAVLMSVINQLLSDPQQAELPIQASQLYGRLPLVVARALYDPLRATFENRVRDFDTWFPEPPGMEEYRALRDQLESQSDAARKQQSDPERK